jgi:tetratricopeptide (TPR) repeat protein
MIGIKTHHPRHTNFLLLKMEAMLLDAASGEEGRRQLDLSRDRISIYCKLAATFLKDKDYKNSRIFLAKAASEDPADKNYLAIKKIYDSETAGNRWARGAISRAYTSTASPGFLSDLALSLAGFIEKRYTVLSPLVGPLLHKAVQLAPDSLPAALNLAGWLLQQDRVAKTLALTEKHLAANPDSPPLLELAGQCYFALGDNEKTAATLSKLLEIYPGHPNWRQYTNFLRTYVANPATTAENPPAGSQSL